MKTTTIPIPSDLHVNSNVGLFTEGQWEKEAGGFHDPSVTQRIIRSQLKECTDAVRYMSKRSRLMVPFNGDIVDMCYHNKAERITQSGPEAVRMAAAVVGGMLDDIGAKDNTPVFIVSGTDSHVGRMGKWEESLARDLAGVVPGNPGTSAQDYSDGRYTRFHLRLSVYGHIVDIAHHGPAPGRRQWTKENALWYELKNIYYNCLETGQPIPRVWVRSHYHTEISVEFKGKHGKILGILTPGFTSKSGYSHRATKSVGLADIGLSIVKIAEDGTVEYECPKVEYQDTPITEV